MQKNFIKEGLLTGSCPKKYESGVDYHIFQGKSSIYLKSKENVTQEEFGTLMCTIKAGRYRGKRLRLTAFIKTEYVKGWAGLWMGIMGENAELLAMDNMRNRPIKHTKNWEPHSIILDVEENAIEIATGILLFGEGCIWVTHLQLEEVDKKMTLANLKASDYECLPIEPINLQFEGFWCKNSRSIANNL
ncbi:MULTISPECIES: hypothetical protein [unclassified Bacillus (in: firmicutes)]|uniref:hypothetical protein n=1 Tax=unclassified Bacillus (in: firmicutes) TaxID=185979 RepID=UPI000BFA5217|nr:MULTISPECIES: hypothetical protein [unclassified Bacillus (in: firmicutes)]PEU15493.1 hypothetical protein CN525_17230 [Bacillus sp. AFS014408]PFW64158.1 hypothetical protein COL20_05765 [Bacillus sp. AFS075034]